MARLNIEDAFWLDIVDVAIKLGDQDKAIGNALRWFRFAQEKHKAGKVVTEQEFREKGFTDALIPNFAKRTDGGIRAVGDEKHFDWLKDKSEIGRLGGIKSAQRPRDKKGRLQAKTKQTPSKTKHSQPSPSLSSSPSSSPSDSCWDANAPNDGASPAVTHDIEPALVKTKDGVKINGVSEFIALRRKLHLETHGVPPIEGGQANGILSSIAKEVPRAEVPGILEYFYKVPNNFYRSSGHDLKILRKDLSKILTEVRRKAPIIPDAKADTYNKALKAKSREDELERMLSNRKGGVA